MKGYTKLKRLNEHHGEDWNPELLDMSVNTFLDKLKEVDPTAYSEMEKLIDAVSSKITGEEHHHEMEDEFEEEEEGEILTSGEDEIPTFDQVAAPEAPGAPGSAPMPTFSEFNM